MKRVIIVAAVLCLLLPVCVSAVTDINRSTEIDVFARFDEMWDENTYIASRENGSYSVTTKSGEVDVTVVSGELPSDARLMVIAIPPDSEAYTWIASVLDEKGEKYIPYDIFFYSDEGRIDFEGTVEITLSLPSGYASPQVYGVFSDGEALLLPSESTRRSISFKASQNSYYVPVSTSGEPINPDDPEPPNTGDETVMWAALALISGVCIYLLSKRREKRV